jgi:hypothetical protein
MTVLLIKPLSTRLLAAGELKRSVASLSRTPSVCSHVKVPSPSYVVAESSRGRFGPELGAGRRCSCLWTKRMRKRPLQGRQLQRVAASR